VRTDEETGHHIAKHKRLLEPLEDKGHHTCHHKYKRKVFDEIGKF